MVSEKIIVLLIVVAILLSVVSIAITFSSLNSNSIPEIQIKKEAGVPDSDKGQVAIGVDPTPGVAP